MRFWGENSIKLIKALRMRSARGGLSLSGTHKLCMPHTKEIDLDFKSTKACPKTCTGGGGGGDP